MIGTKKGIALPAAVGRGVRHNCVRRMGSPMRLTQDGLAWVASVLYAIYIRCMILQRLTKIV